MSAITSMDNLVAALRSPLSLYKASVANAIAGQYQSLWTAAGFPSAGATPTAGAGAINNSATQGALAIPSLASGESLYLAKVNLGMATAGMLTIYDRLVTTSGLSGTVTTAQAINSVAMDRYADGYGIEAFLEFYGAVGATASIPTVSYTNSDGTAGRTSVLPSIASANVGRMFPILPQAGDKGIRSIQSVTLSASTTGAGNFGVTFMQRLADIPVILGNTGIIVDAFGLGLPKLADYGNPQPCIAFSVFCTTTSTGVINGSINMAIF